jgi:hypothetical protein
MSFTKHFSQAILIAFSLLCLFPTTTIAQQWEKYLGGSSSDLAWHNAKLADGGSIIVGASQSKNRDVRYNRGQYDAWLVRTDAKGNILWQKTFGTAMSDMFSHVESLSDGSFWVSGNYDCFVGSFNYVGLKDEIEGVLIHFDANGNVLSQKRFPHRLINTFSINTDGTIVLVGIVEDPSVPNFHANTNGPNEEDIWVAKTTAAGDLIWQKAFGGKGIEQASIVKIAADGSIIIGGNTNSIDGDLTGPRGFLDIWVFSLTQNGSINWQKTLGGISDSESILDLVFTNDGGVLLLADIGYADGDITPPINNATGRDRDVWLVKLNAAHQIAWNRVYGGKERDEAHTIIPLANGAFGVVGSSESYDGDLTLPRTGSGSGIEFGWYFTVSGNGGLIQNNKVFGGSNGYLGTNASLYAADSTVLVLASDDERSSFFSTRGIDIYLAKIEISANSFPSNGSQQLILKAQPANGG